MPTPEEYRKEYFKLMEMPIAPLACEDNARMAKRLFSRFFDADLDVHQQKAKSRINDIINMLETDCKKVMTLSKGRTEMQKQIRAKKKKKKTKKKETTKEIRFPSPMDLFTKLIPK